MDGETKRRSVQPGGRAPAPGELALVQAFINTHYDLEVDHGADLFASPASLRHWLRRQRLIDETATVDEPDRLRLIAAREALRALASGGDPDDADVAPDVLDALNDAAAGAGVEVRFSAQAAARFVPAPASGIAGALGLVLAITAQAINDGSWARLKVCPGEDCGWVFYDHSRNRTGRWCSMSVCGGRVKARNHYRRRREGTRA